MMETDKVQDERADDRSVEDEAKLADLELAGETTAAATGSTEIAAATGETAGESSGHDRPVGADTMVKVAEDSDSKREH